MSGSEQKYLIKVLDPCSPHCGKYWREFGCGITERGHLGYRFSRSMITRDLLLRDLLENRLIRLVHVWEDRK